MRKNSSSLAVVSLPASDIDWASPSVHVTEALRLARELYEHSSLFAGSYRSWVHYAREHLLPKEVTAVLLKVGFSESVVSRIKAIHALPEDSYKPYEQGKIGFRAVVEAAVEHRARETGKRRRKLVFAHSMAALTKDFVRHQGSIKPFAWTFRRAEGERWIVAVVPAGVGEHDLKADKASVIVNVLGEVKKA